MPGAIAGGIDRTLKLLQLLNDVVGASKFGDDVTSMFKNDCTDLVRRIALLMHLFEEIRVFKDNEFGPLDASTSSTNSDPTESWVSDLVVALQGAKRIQRSGRLRLPLHYSLDFGLFRTGLRIQQKQQLQKQKLEEQQRRKHAIFHDFLVMKPGDSPVVLAPKASTDCRFSKPSPSASASFGASSDGSRGPISTTSDLGFDGHVNPAVTSSLFLAKKLSLTKSVFYMFMPTMKLLGNLLSRKLSALCSTKPSEDARQLLRKIKLSS
ncbi:hypothetical protein ACFX11_037327 [Malus domestica]